MTRFLRLTSLAFALALTVTACGETDDQALSTVADSVPVGTVAPSTEPGGTATTGPSGPIPSTVTSPTPGGGTRHLTAVRAANQPEGDRVTFEFAGDSAPGYEIGYVEGPVRQDGSGDPVRVEGPATMSVRFDGASSVDLTGGINRTYTGPSRFTPPDTGTVVEMAQVSDFEAQLIWAIGTRSQKPFQVTKMTGPARVVIDFSR